MKIFVALQTPVIEIQVKASDASGKTESMLVGFKRYVIDEAQKRSEELQKLFQDLQQDDDGKTTNLTMKQICQFIKGEVVYLKEVRLQVEKEEGSGKLMNFVLKDTRDNSGLGNLWPDGEAALSDLLDMFLESAPWRSSLMSASMTALLNIDLNREAETKN